MFRRGVARLTSLLYLNILAVLCFAVLRLAALGCGVSNPFHHVPHEIHDTEIIGLVASQKVMYARHSLPDLPNQSPEERKGSTKRRTKRRGRAAGMLDTENSRESGS